MFRRGNNRARVPVERMRQRSRMLARALLSAPRRASFRTRLMQDRFRSPRPYGRREEENRDAASNCGGEGWDASAATQASGLIGSG
jgi:hypothetical protein